MYCFRASYEGSTQFESGCPPAWLSLEVDWQGYKISTLPWVVEAARALGSLAVEEDTPDEWISYLENLGFKDVHQVVCEEWFEDRGYS